MDKIQVDILGISSSPSNAGAYALILKELHGNRRLPIIIGAFEAQAIALELEGMKPPRPLTHDLMKTIIDTFAVSLNEVYINELRDGTFYAKLIIEGVSNTEEIDSRPSDAIALAVRYSVPMFVDADVLNEAGIRSEGEEEEQEPPQEGEEQPPVKQYTTKYEQLQAALKDAIEKEDYERAAKIRDELRKLGVSEQ
ncbi:MAG TPA: bifunctional nuclease domain-containing protein [Bacteroidota bacterium]|nr:bifunctional nuclease domain-containing protein [Bacteroidota bacterium]